MSITCCYAIKQLMIKIDTAMDTVRSTDDSIYLFIL